jgi:tetratricopeptide (TPR) repeat protein
MRHRFSLLTLAVALIAASPACAEPGSWADAPEKLPRAARGDRSKNLDFLFEALRAAPDSDSAKLVESRIWALWLASGSDTTDLLMSRVKSAIDGKDTNLAIELLDAVIELRPDYVEAWNRRATLHFTNKDFGKSLADIRALAVNPHLQKIPEFVKTLTDKVEGRDI